MIVFIAELIKIQANAFLMGLTSEGEIETIIHGFRADLEGSLHNIEAIGNILFGDAKAGIQPVARC